MNRPGTPERWTAHAGTEAPTGRNGSSPRFAATAPANLLIMGEYAVLEEEGLGISVAPDIRATASVTPDGTDTAIIGRMAHRTVRWPGDRGLLGTVANRLASRYPPHEACFTVDLDSTAFFARDGHKLGFGSSAAVTVALTAAWLRVLGHLPPDPVHARALIFREALCAHRAGQLGRGSGYDVACSTFGGLTLFTGGERPQAHRADLPWLPALRLFRGPAPVRTVSAVDAYRKWATDHPHERSAFLNHSNALVTAFSDARSWDAAAEILLAYRALTRTLGRDIGIPAELGTPYDGIPDGSVVKPVGAGNELAVVFGGNRYGRLIPIAAEGVTWR